MAALTQPYVHSEAGNPVYLDGFDFAGLLTMQTCTESWPATAGLEDQTINVLQAYADSTKVTKIMTDDDDEEGDKIANMGML